MNTKKVFSLLSRPLLATLCVSLSGVALAKDSNLPLSHVVVNFDAAWVGKELKVGDAKNKSAVLNNATDSLVVILIDVVATKATNADDPLAIRNLASQMAKQKYLAYNSISEKGSLPTIATKHFSSGWSCIQSVLKKTPNADDIFATYCATIDRGFEVYAFLETRQPTTEKGMNMFKTLLQNISQK